MDFFYHQVTSNSRLQLLRKVHLEKFSTGASLGGVLIPLCFKKIRTTKSTKDKEGLRPSAAPYRRPNGQGSHRKDGF